MVNINTKNLTDNSQWISREFREFSAGYALRVDMYVQP